MAPEDIVRAQHEHDDIGGRLLHPGRDVAVGDVDGQPTRMPLVMLVPVGRLGLAVLRVAVLRADVLDPAGVVGGSNLIPHQGAPARYLGDAVSQGHCFAVREKTPGWFSGGLGHVLMRSLDI